MKSSVAGNVTSKAEVTNISVHGIWLLFKNKEHFLPYEDFPWFKDAKISEIHNVHVLHKNHLFWPDIDVDLSMQILESLESYPLVWK